MIDQLVIGIILGTAFVFLLLLVIIMTLLYILSPGESMDWHIWYAWYPVKINGRWVWRRLIERRGRCYRELGEMR